MPWGAILTYAAILTCAAIRTWAAILTNLRRQPQPAPPASTCASPVPDRSLTMSSGSPPPMVRHGTTRDR